METEKYFPDYQPDAIDQQILALLKKNGKLSSKEIAGETGLTITPVYERIKRLEKLNFITGYHAHINKKKTGKDLRVLCNISLKSHALELLNKFEQEIIHLKEVSSCFHIAGNFDYLLLIEVKDMNEYSEFLKEKLANIPHIATVQSSFIMKTIKES